MKRVKWYKISYRDIMYSTGIQPIFYNKYMGKIIYKNAESFVVNLKLT